MASSDIGRIQGYLQRLGQLHICGLLRMMPEEKARIDTAPKLMFSVIHFAKSCRAAVNASGYKASTTRRRRGSSVASARFPSDEAVLEALPSRVVHQINTAGNTEWTCEWVVVPPACDRATGQASKTCAESSRITIKLSGSACRSPPSRQSESSGDGQAEHQ